MFFQGSWEAICYQSSWDINAANVACRQMKVGPAISAGGDNTVSFDTSLSMTRLHCTGTEKRLIDCDHNYADLMECGVMGVATIQCRTYQAASAEEGIVYFIKFI